MEKHVQEIFHIAHMHDSTKNRDIYDRMWQTIMEVAPLQSEWMKPVPARWVAFEHELIRLKKSGQVIVTTDEMLQVNKRRVAPLAADDIPAFLR